MCTVSIVQCRQTKHLSNNYCRDIPQQGTHWASELFWFWTSPCCIAFLPCGNTVHRRVSASHVGQNILGEMKTVLTCSGTVSSINGIFGGVGGNFLALGESGYWKNNFKLVFNLKNCVLETHFLHQFIDPFTSTILNFKHLT